MGTVEPKIVLFDLETLPNLEKALEVWPQIDDYPGKTLRSTITSIICAGFKVYSSGEKTRVINAWDFPNWEINVNDDSFVCEEIYRVLHDADAVVTHNGVRFDWKYLQTRLLINNLPLLPKIPHIDTKALASKHLFSFNNRLGYLGEWMVKDQKMSHEGWKLWVKVYKRNQKAMQTMSKYCAQDVDLLEKVFVKLKPLAYNIPNYNLFVDPGKVQCPRCGSTRLWSKGFKYTATRYYRRYKCKDCGGYARTDSKDKNMRSI